MPPLQSPQLKRKIQQDIQHQPLTVWPTPAIAMKIEIHNLSPAITYTGGGTASTPEPL
jgi:hypothetical protein